MDSELIWVDCKVKLGWNTIKETIFENIDKYYLNSTTNYKTGSFYIRNNSLQIINYENSLDLKSIISTVFVHPNYLKTSSKILTNRIIITNGEYEFLKLKFRV